MSIPFEKTDISVGPPFIREVGEGTTVTWGFDAEAPVTGVEARIIRLIPLAMMISMIETAELDGQTGNVTVSGFIYGEQYNLIVTFSDSSGKEWDRSLRIHCVA